MAAISAPFSHSFIDKGRRVGDEGEQAINNQQSVKSSRSS